MRRWLILLGVPLVLSALLAVGAVTKILPLDPLETFGFITGVWGVWLQVRENVWNWPIQLVSSAIYVFVFFKARLYSDTLLNVLYVGLYILGWYWWLRGGENRGELHIGRTSWRLWAVLTAVTAVTTFGWTLVLVRINDSAPFLDALTTIVSFVALFMTARKLFENWWVWTAVNLVYIGLYVYKSLDLTALLYAIFAGLSVAGWVNWGRLLRAQEAREVSPEGAAA